MSAVGRVPALTQYGRHAGEELPLGSSSISARRVLQRRAQVEMHDLSSKGEIGGGGYVKENLRQWGPGRFLIASCAVCLGALAEQIALAQEQSPPNATNAV
jgi:hypothetical protein